RVVYQIDYGCKGALACKENERNSSYRTEYLFHRFSPVPASYGSLGLPSPCLASWIVIFCDIPNCRAILSRIKKCASGLPFNRRRVVNTQERKESVLSYKSPSCLCRSYGSIST